MNAARSSLVAACALTAALAATPTRGDEQDFQRIERGRYLATVGDCAPCHTIPGKAPYTGGRALATPFGTLLTPNLTPDKATGLGSWSNSEFLDALQKGIGRGGYHLYPGLPYTSYTKVSRDDLLAIRAYLATLPAVHHPVVTNQLPFPFNIRAALAAWNALYFTPGEFQGQADKSPAWNRGAYLVEGLGHCGSCHTPKTRLGGDDADNQLAGGVLQGWFAPAINGDAYRGVGGWSVDDIVAYLQTGVNARAAASGPMSEVVAESTSRMKRDDLVAIATYLKDVAAPADSTRPQPLDPKDPRMTTGQAIYVDNCAACHTMGGTGAPHLFPTLKGSPSVQSSAPTTLLRVVLRGTQTVATSGAPTAAAMPAFGWRLNDDQVAAVLTYVRNAWGNAASPVSPGEVRSARSSVAQE